VAAFPFVDPGRIVMVGESNGGMMAYAFACAHGDLLAGVASVGGTPMTHCASPRPLATMHVHGLNDQTVPYQGGASTIGNFLGIQFPPVAASVTAFATGMGCEATPTVTRSGPVSIEDRPCPGGARSRLVTIDGMGHGWPSGSPYDATGEILRYFGLDH
jgi:polyhydroxybutyrate depolymerase